MIGTTLTDRLVIGAEYRQGHDLYVVTDARFPQKMAPRDPDIEPPRKAVKLWRCARRRTNQANGCRGPRDNG